MSALAGMGLVAMVLTAQAEDHHGVQRQIEKQQGASIRPTPSGGPTLDAIVYSPDALEAAAISDTA